MKNSEKVLLGAACFFAGVVAGFLIAPIKEGIHCGNNNGNQYGPISNEVEDGKDENIEGGLEI